jgi:hypothetical protein
MKESGWSLSRSPSAVPSARHCGAACFLDPGRKPNVKLVEAGIGEFSLRLGATDARSW